MTLSPSLKANPNVYDWIRVAPDGRVHVRSGQIDLGQRVSVPIAIIAAEEFGLNPEDIAVDPRISGVTPNEGLPAGSQSIDHSGGVVRLAAATTRCHLIAQAGGRLSADPSTLTKQSLIQDVLQTSRNGLTLWLRQPSKQTSDVWNGSLGSDDDDDTGNIRKLAGGLEERWASSVRDRGHA